MSMNAFQIIFTPTSAAELARMPKELQLQILGDFRGLPQHVIASELEDFGKLESDGHILHRFRVGEYRVYFERHQLGVLVHRILSRHTLKDFFFRSGIKVGEDQALQENPKFWELIEAAKTAENCTSPAQLHGFLQRAVLEFERLGGFGNVTAVNRDARVRHTFDLQEN